MRLLTYITEERAYNEQRFSITTQTRDDMRPGGNRHVGNIHVWVSPVKTNKEKMVLSIHMQDQVAQKDFPLYAEFLAEVETFCSLLESDASAAHWIMARRIPFSELMEKMGPGWERQRDNYYIKEVEC